MLLVHGLLHLMGHDHIEDDERAEMAAAEDALLAALPAMAEWPTTSGLSDDKVAHESRHPRAFQVAEQSNLDAPGASLTSTV